MKRVQLLHRGSNGLIDSLIDERYKPFRQFPNIGHRIVCVGVIIYGHDLIHDRDSALVIHLVREVVQVPEQIQEVTTHPQLMEGHQWVAYTREL